MHIILLLYILNILSDTTVLQNIFFHCLNPGESVIICSELKLMILFSATWYNCNIVQPLVTIDYQSKIKQNQSIYSQPRDRVSVNSAG